MSRNKSTQEKPAIKSPIKTVVNNVPQQSTVTAPSVTVPTLDPFSPAANKAMAAEVLSMVPKFTYAIKVFTLEGIVEINGKSPVPRAEIDAAVSRVKVEGAVFLKDDNGVITSTTFMPAHILKIIATLHPVETGENK